MAERRKYTQRFKEESAELGITSERTIAEVSAAEAPSREDPGPIHLIAVRSAGDSAWRREDIHDDAGR